MERKGRMCRMAHVIIQAVALWLHVVEDGDDFAEHARSLVAGGKRGEGWWGEGVCKERGRGKEGRREEGRKGEGEEGKSSRDCRDAALMQSPRTHYPACLFLSLIHTDTDTGTYIIS